MFFSYCANWCVKYIMIPRYVKLSMEKWICRSLSAVTPTYGIQKNRFVYYLGVQNKFLESNSHYLQRVHTLSNSIASGSNRRPYMDARLNNHFFDVYLTIWSLNNWIYCLTKAKSGISVKTSCKTTQYWPRPISIISVVI